MIIEDVKKFVEEECNKKTAMYKGALEEHFIPVVKYSKILGKKEGADLEILEIAAWLHDIGSILYGRENHHITSCKIAEKKLKEWGYPQNKTEKVKHCIISHRGSIKIVRESKEANILAEADGMSHFDSIAGLLKSAFIEEKKNVKEAKEYVKEKLQRSWDKLSDNAKNIIKPKFDAARLLLK